MPSKKFPESKQIASQQTNRSTFSVSDPLTKSEIDALRHKKKSIGEELQSKIADHVARQRH
jgi:hypothetical protein